MFCDEHGTLDYCPYCMDEERALEINTELLEALEEAVKFEIKGEQLLAKCQKAIAKAKS